MTSISPEFIVDFVRTIGRCDQEFGNDSPLFTSGLLDSFLMVELIIHLEDSGGFQIPPEAITLENLDSVNSIIRYVATLEA